MQDVGFVVPPFIDPHIHGGWGYSFQKAEFAPLEERLIREGVLCAIPTLANDSLDNLRETARLFREYKSRRPRSIFPFLRVEGPFINPEKKGFQRGEHILEVDSANLEAFFSIEEIRCFTFAPEVEGMEELLDAAEKAGSMPSVGHSNGTFADFTRAYRRGVRHFTHFPNALRGLHHRELGMAGAGLLYDDVMLEVIGDGIHNGFPFLSLLLKIKGPEFALMSDMIPPARSSRSEFEGKKIIKHGMVMKDEQGMLAGGGQTVAGQVTSLFGRGVPPEHLVRIGALNASRFHNLPLPLPEEGEEATFLVLDENMRVTDVFLRGERVREETGESGDREGAGEGE